MPKRIQTKKQRQRALFQDKLYNLLRLYQTGRFDAPSGGRAGRLDYALTTLMDGVVQIYDETVQGLMAKPRT